MPAAETVKDAGCPLVDGRWLEEIKGGLSCTEGLERRGGQRERQRGRPQRREVIRGREVELERERQRDIDRGGTELRWALPAQH